VSDPTHRVFRPAGTANQCAEGVDVLVGGSDRERIDTAFRVPCDQAFVEQPHDRQLGVRQDSRLAWCRRQVAIRHASWDLRRQGDVEIA
jgi:hypothetical protein